MKKIIGILFFIVVNVLNLSAVNAQTLVPVTDEQPEIFLNNLRKVVATDNVRKFATMEISEVSPNYDLNYSNQDTGINLQCFASQVTVNGNLKSVIAFYLDDVNMIKAIVIAPVYQSFDSMDEGRNIIGAMLMSTFFNIGLSSDEFNQLFQGVIDQVPSNNIWCEKSQRYILAMRSDDGIIFIGSFIN